MLSSRNGDCRPQYGVAPQRYRKAITLRQISKSLPVRSAWAWAPGLAVIALPEIAMAQISVSITLPPPALPAYEQPFLVELGWDLGPKLMGLQSGRLLLGARALGMGRRRRKCSIAKRHEVREMSNATKRISGLRMT
jgi:hypothetical protein